MNLSLQETLPGRTMEVVYILIFAVQALLAGILEYSNRLSVKGKNNDETTSPEFLAFRNNYLVVYSLMMAGDWLQGPYVYALYQHYGFNRGEIGRLFIAGFGSSMVFGTIVGGMSDRYGRRMGALLYVAFYAFGCFTKHFNSFWVLFVGRVFCGIATSLLFSVFESWLVAEHFRRGFAGEWLATTFSKAVFLGNGLVAILAGLVAHSLVETLSLGPVAPFDAAATVLGIGGIIVASKWTENYGDSSSASNQMQIFQGFQKAASVIVSQPKIALLGAMQALFEAAMYTFVFLWTPALSPRNEHIPHGMIFACFMVSSMVGSATAGRLLSGNSKIKVERYMQAVFAIGAVCLSVPVFFHFRDDAAVKQDSLLPEGKNISVEGKLQLIAFCAFEVVVGIFWPSMMTLRSEYVPEEMRSTIINFFRVPLNLFVCIVLYNVSSFALSTMFAMCSLFLLMCFLCQRYLAFIIHCEQAGTHFDEDIGSNTVLAHSIRKDVSEEKEPIGNDSEKS